MAWVLGLAGSAGAQTANPYESEIVAFEQADLRNPPPTNSIVFVGSSSIRIWTDLPTVFPEYSVLNRGFGGSQASDVLFFFDRLVPPYQPPLVVFYEGDNDLAGGRSVDTVFGDWTNFVGRVKAALPATDIMFLAVKPSPSRAQFLGVTKELNDRVRAQCEGDPRLRFTDVCSPMLNASGQPRPELFGSDALHMNAAGYALWVSIIGPALDAWAADYPVPVKKPKTDGLLLDFGSAEFPSGGTGQVSAVRWNNVTTSIGANNSGVLANVVKTDGTTTGVSLRMVSRFNGANENGTGAAAEFPDSATRDSLYGNTESFNGLVNIAPVFRLTGLNVGTTYRLTFYASRLSASDNRETVYTVTGAGTASTNLNVAGNVEQTVSVGNIGPDDNGEIFVALTPGPKNNNANHFTYLGVLRVDPSTPSGPGFLFDFGATGSPTGDQGTTGPSWNDLTAEIGSTDTGILTELVATNGTPTGIDLRMVSRFNGANTSGSQASTVFPANATRDSLFGNTETFGGLAGVAPAFRFTGLDPAGTYRFTFYASRDGVTDNRQTRYTVTGASTASADLNTSTNIDQTAVVSDVHPNGAGEIVVSLTPGPENNNANHFTYLGAMSLDWVIYPVPAAKLSATLPGTGKIQLRLQGAPGHTYQLQQTGDLMVWEPLQEIVFTNGLPDVEIPTTGPPRFFRLAE